MIQTRKSQVNDEAWIIEKVNQIGYNSIDLSPTEFMIAVDGESEERFAFARRQFIRSHTDEKEFVEINNFVLLQKSDARHGCVLVRDIIEEVKDNQDQVFAFPHRDKEVFKEVGFEVADTEKLPPAVSERYSMFRENFGSEVEPLIVRPSNVEYSQDEVDEPDKPKDSTDEEIEEIKEDLGYGEDTTTKYTV